ncbi:MAG: exonuclease SbcCD subunit D [Caldilineaceae bacterium]|nr:exonuclease SbcCD subunit D [Caldilineaceae bacterium]MBP8108634.1 exonuclease SbcCD subunit D [Caldilineaceae bacterium]MBP8123187.1 exonuclease SbcCD subunit D [Caldilineaceae bacterium]MBP9072409.1 exonuclease SbcCD subunit D [Caldilineaceae bacterium]
MKTKFLHIADLHLGYDQYGHKERFNDFTRAFKAVIDAAITEKVAFVILAGDLFQKRAIDALTLGQAMRVLTTLKQAGIPCIAVEGNHEKAYYKERLGWMEFLANQDLLTLLSPDFEAAPFALTPYAKHKGAYIDPVPGLRVIGLKYMGSSTAAAIERTAEALAALPDEAKAGIEYTIFVAHTGIEGVLAGQSGGLSHRQLAPLRPHVDYLALGHIHKPFTFDNWIYNPGSPETCSLTEAQWPERGYFVVEVDTDKERAEDEPKHTATLRANPRRPFHRFSVKTDLHQSPEALMEWTSQFLTRKARDLGASKATGQTQPVVELSLFGNLPFDRSALDLAVLKALVDEHFHPLVTLVKNQTQPTEFEIRVEEGMTRPQLERQILSDLFMQDDRFAAHRDAWADLAVTLKGLAVSNTPAEAILAELEAGAKAIENGDLKIENG